MNSIHSPLRSREAQGWVKDQGGQGCGEGAEEQGVAPCQEGMTVNLAQIAKAVKDIRKGYSGTATKGLLLPEGKGTPWRQQGR